MPRRAALVTLVASLGLVASACSSGSSSTGTIGATGRVLLVGTYKGRAGQYQTVQSAVSAASPGDWVLVAPGDYHEQYDHATSVGPKALAGLYITTPRLHVRGMDRNAVVVDGTKPGAAQCSPAPADQDFGPTDTTGKPTGRNGVEVWKADGVWVENLTTCNFLSGSEGGGNQVWWNGGDGSGTVGLGPYGGSYLSATTTYAGNNGDGSYGVFVSNSSGPGVISHSYSSNMSDSNYYVGACPDCNATLDDVHGQYSALGYSGTNAGGHLVVKNSEFDHNKTGFSTNSQNNDDAPSPQDGTCPNNGTGPTGTRSCWVFENNYVHDNNVADVPGHGSAALGPPGNGLVLAGGRNDTIVNNRFENNGSWAILIVPFPDTGTPPPVAHCVGGDPNGLPSAGLKGCFYASWGNEVAHNMFKNNGGFANVTNGDLAEISDRHDPGNCWHDNVNPAGVSSSPPHLEQTNAVCGAAHSGAAIGSDLTAQVVCATEILAPCPPAPGMNYPRSDKPVLRPLSPQPTMPNPCAGVPSNPWCTKRGPISSSPLLAPLLAWAKPSRPRRRRLPSPS